MIYKNFSNYDIDIVNGVVYSNCFNKHRVLGGRITPDGYVACGVTDDKGNRYYRLHQVIYCAANGITKDEYPKDENGFRFEIDHIDGDRTNNSIYNLRLVSKKENMNNEVTKINRSKAQRKLMALQEARDRISKSLINRKDKSKPIAKLNEKGEIIEVYKSLMDVHRQTGLNVGRLSAVARGLANKCGGYKWKYLDEHQN